MTADIDSGTPVLLLLPGLDGTGQTAGSFVACLGERVRPFTVNYPTGPHLYRAELARTVLAEWPTARSVVVLGESYSTAVAVTVAAARPPGLAGVILITPSFTARPRRSLRLLAPLLPPVRPPAAFLRWLLLDHRGPAADLLAAAVARVPARVLRARLREYLAEPAADDPTGVAVPVLAIRAARDRLLRTDSTAFRPGVEWITLNAPHLVLAAVPEAAADAIAGFVTRVTGSV